MLAATQLSQMLPTCRGSQTQSLLFTCTVSVPSPVQADSADSFSLEEKEVKGKKRGEEKLRGPPDNLIMV